MIMNALKIFSANFADENATYTCSSGQAAAVYLYDQNQATKWLSVSSSDATEETIEITFNTWQGSEVSRTFDRIILLNHNVKAGGADYWDGASWVAIAEATFTGATSGFSYIEIATPIAASRVRLRLSTTQVANAEKFVGEVKFCLSIFAGTQQWRSSLPREDEQRSGALRTGSGRLVFWREWTKFGASGTLAEVTQADHDLLLPYLKANQFVTVIFWQDQDPSECYEVALTEPPKHDINRKTGLYEISLELQEK